MGLFGPPNVAKLDNAGKIAELVKAAKYKKDPAVREAARASLTGMLDKVIQRLQTKNVVELEAAREALVIIGEPARDRLIFILREGHVHRRQDAAFVLGMMGDPKAVKPLTMALHNPDPLLRLLCVQALAKIGDPEGMDVVRQALGDGDAQVAAAARKALKAAGMLPSAG